MLLGERVCRRLESGSRGRPATSLSMSGPWREVRPNYLPSVWNSWCRLDNDVTHSGSGCPVLEFSRPDTPYARSSIRPRPAQGTHPTTSAADRPHRIAFLLSGAGPDTGGVWGRTHS